MTSKDKDAVPASIAQLSHDVVADWIENESICLRPAQQQTLENAIAKTVPVFLEAHSVQALDRYIQSARQEERKACMDIAADMTEPFPGFISKQRLLNLYAYPEANQSNEAVS